MSEVISFRASDKLCRVLRYKAQQSGLSLSKYVRKKLVQTLVREQKEAEEEDEDL